MTAQASHPKVSPESLESRLDHDVRILPKPGNDASVRDSVLLAFDFQTHEPLQDDRFAYSLERTLGVRAENRIQVPLTWVDDGKILTPSDPGFFERTKAMRSGAIPGELAGYSGIRLSREGMSSADERVAAGIAALISDIYQGDEQLRLLHNHTREEATEPIEITGPNYNLAEEATQEHPTVDLKEIVSHPVSLRHVQTAPNLARVSFAA